MVVLLATLGIGFGGVLAGLLRRRSDSDTLALTSLAYALVTTLLPIVVVAYAGPGPTFLYFLVAFLLFLLSGLVVSLVLTEYAHTASAVYLWDLGGAACGVLLSMAALSAWGPVSTMLLLSALGATAGLCFSRSSALRVASIVGAGMSLFLFSLTLLYGWLDVDPRSLPSQKPLFQALRASEARLVFSRWTAFARTDVLEPRGDREKFVLVDGASSSSMRRFNGDMESIKDLKGDLGFLPYEFRRLESGLIIGPGGGKDILLGLLGGTRRITAVEVDPGTKEAMRHFGSFNGGIYEVPSVKLVVDEGRSFLRRAEGRYDLIFLSLVRVGTSERAGVALTESYLYTVEAFSEYLDHLNEGGILFMRVYTGPELIKAFATAVAAFEQRGLSAAEGTRHLLAVTDPRLQDGPEPRYPALLITRASLGVAEARRLVDLASGKGFAVLYAPFIKEEGAIADISAGMSLESFVRREGQVDLTPPRDDSPFFYKLQPGLPTEVRWPLWISVMLDLVIMLGFLWSAPTDRRVALRVGGYFGALGLGFMLVEIALMHRLALFLGHPVVAVATVLCALLLSAGVGSLLSGAVPESRLVPTVLVAGLGVAVLSVVHLTAGSSVLSVLMRQPGSMGSRILIASASVFPLGLLLGMPFPIGVRWLKYNGMVSKVPLAWAINGAASVTGAVGAVAIGMVSGFTLSILASSVCYGTACLLFYRLAGQSDRSARGG